MKIHELRGLIREEVRRVINENKVRNSYAIQSPNHEGYYSIDKKKALTYLSKFNDKKAWTERGTGIDAKKFMDPRTLLGWDSSFEEYPLEDVEKMTNKQIEKLMRDEMSLYYFGMENQIK